MALLLHSQAVAGHAVASSSERTLGDGMRGVAHERTILGDWMP